MAMTPALRDHTAEAYNRLCHQFKDKPNIQALLAIFTAQFDELEAAYYALLIERTIYNAVGAVLDQIGAKVGQPRNGMIDDDYRRYIFARIAANKSDGLVEDLIDITRLILNDDSQLVQVVTQGIASTVVRVLGERIDWSIAKIIAELLRTSVVAGVRMILEFMTFSPVVLKKIGGVTGSSVDSGASTVETFSGDGWVQTTVQDPEGNGAGTTTGKMIGLSTTYASIGLGTMQYAFFAKSDGTLSAYELGVEKIALGTYALGDVLRIERVGSAISFKKNGTIVYTSTTSSTGALKVCVALEHISIATGRKSSWGDVRFYDAGIRKLITWQGAVNVDITPYNPSTSTFSQRMRFSDATIYNAGAGGHPQTALATKAAAAGFGTWSAGYLFDAKSGNLPAVFGTPDWTFAFAQPNMGPKYGCPGVRGFSDNAIELIAGGANSWSGGNVYSLAAGDDIAIIWTGVHVAATSSGRCLITKGSGTLGAGGYFGILANETSGGTLIARAQASSPATQYQSTISMATLIGKAYVGCMVLERATNKIRIAARSLDGTVQLTGPETTVAAAEPFGSANNLILGANLGLDGLDRLQISSMYLGHGSGAATGMSANIVSILTSFANQLNSWPYLRNLTVPTYGNGLDDYNDKYPASLTGLRSALIAGTIADIGSTTGITGYLCNESSGNLVPAFGSGPTLVAAGTPLYQRAGLRGGRDYSIGFDANADQFAGGTGDYNVTATDDLIVGWCGLLGRLPPGVQFMFVKGNAGAARWSMYFDNATNAFRLELVSASGVVVTSIALATIVGKPHIGIAVIDRGAAKARAVIRSLDGTVSLLSAEVTPFAETMSNADAFTFGNRAASLAAVDWLCSGFFIGVGTNVAYGTSANLSAIATRFAAAINHYYGGNLAAAME